MRIGFCGTMSVGKTTLVNALKEYDEFKDYEFRTERSKYLSSLGIPLNTDSTLKGQTIFLSERCVELMKIDIITDRTVIDVMAFANNARSISDIKAEKFEEYASLFLWSYDHIFYVSPKGVEIENNGIRETNSKYRDQIDKTIRQLLKKYNGKGNIRNLYKLSGSTEDRVKKVLEVTTYSKASHNIYK